VLKGIAVNQFKKGEGPDKFMLDLEAARQVIDVFQGDGAHEPRVHGNGQRSEAVFFDEAPGQIAAVFASAQGDQAIIAAAFFMSPKDRFKFKLRALPDFMNGGKVDGSEFGAEAAFAVADEFHVGIVIRQETVPTVSRHVAPARHPLLHYIYSPFSYRVH